MNTDRGRMNAFPGYFAGRDILRDNRCGERFAKKKSFAYHAESQLSKFMPSSEYFDWGRRKDEVAALRLHLAVQKNFSTKLKIEGSAIVLKILLIEIGMWLIMC